jgi:hypothetical protein
VFAQILPCSFVKKNIAPHRCGNSLLLFLFHTTTTSKNF